jgi:hypothetical protein
MSIGVRAIILIVGLVMFAVGIEWWWEAAVMGLWSSVLIVLGFSFLVVGADEWMHALRHQRTARARAASPAH